METGVVIVILLSQVIVLQGGIAANDLEQLLVLQGVAIMLF